MRMVQVVLQVLSLVLTFVPSHCSVAPLCGREQPFDFEVPNQESCFRVVPEGSGALSISTDYATVKHGTKSLKWTIYGPSTLKLKSRAFYIPNSWLSRGGVKLWLYRENLAPFGKTLRVEFIHGKPSETQMVGKFDVNLYFKGWRGIWVKFAECRRVQNSLRSPSIINQVNFVLSDADTIYIDILGFEGSFAKQSRDKIVPPIAPFGLTTYDASNTWQRTYLWSQQPIPLLPRTIDQGKKQSLLLIERRINLWYYNDRRTSSSDVSIGSRLNKTWNSLMTNAKKAHNEYDRLVFDTEGIVIGPPLFCRDCRYGTTKYSANNPTRKFGFVMEKILFPLALEYHLRLRIREAQEEAVKQSFQDLNSGDAARKKAAIVRIAGKHKNMQKRFKQYLSSAGSPLTESKVKAAIEALNKHRLDKINKLLDYVEEQGFADGSALGCLDHEWNRDGAGFTHSLYLIKDSLSKSRLLELIRTAKWYNDFGEVYQSPTFEYKGTTADRMITNMLFRLLVVMAMPSDSDDEIKAKIRDMDALMRWVDNALAVNEGLGGVIKPDYVGFHHKAYYGPAYVPQALHTAALLFYLLGTTEYSLSPTATNNVVRGLETLRTIAVKYSTPNSVNGRFPSYNNKALIKKALPAYAYISISHPPPTLAPASVTASIRLAPDSGTVKMFLRLYEDHSVGDYLDRGDVHVGKYYLSSLGSLDIMEEVKRVAISRGISAELSPEGHWSKNFAVLSIHRRKDWAVTIKGFNHFAWDYEASSTENRYGMFASHGALLIANSEDKLGVHDVNNGWDWSMLPGATTIALGVPDVDDMYIGKRRFYNRRSLAGGVTFKGSKHLANGLFGMDFEQPNYGFNNWRKNITFVFKKSVFFFENLLVCLGSDIEAQNTNGKRVQTTLFQDKLEDGVASSFVKIDGSVRRHSPAFPGTTPSQISAKHTTLTDAKGNGYYIPNPSSKILKVQVQEQSSKSDDGQTTTFGRYAAAWFDHSMPPSSSYEYAVIVPTASYTARLSDFTTAQETPGNEAYKVLQRDATAHVVQFVKSLQTWPTAILPTTGYVIFTPTALLPTDGPIQEVNRECLIMVENTPRFLYLAISYPDLDFPTASGVPPQKAEDIGQEELYHASSREARIEITLRFPVRKSIAEVKVHDTPDCYKPNVWVLSTPASGAMGNKVVFLNLKNGFSVEVKLKKWYTNESY